MPMSHAQIKTAVAKFCDKTLPGAAVLDVGDANDGHGSEGIWIDLDLSESYADQNLVDAHRSGIAKVLGCRRDMIGVNYVPDGPRKDNANYCRVYAWKQSRAERLSNRMTESRQRGK